MNKPVVSTFSAYDIKHMLENYISSIQQIEDNDTAKETALKIAKDVKFVGYDDYKKLEEEVAALKKQPALVSLGVKYDNGVNWFGQNPHAFPVGTMFFAIMPDEN